MNPGQRKRILDRYFPRQREIVHFSTPYSTRFLYGEFESRFVCHVNQPLMRERR